MICLLPNLNAQDKKVSVSADYAYPPYSYFDKFGNPVGLDIDIFKALEEIMNIKFSFNLTEWDSALSNINSGRSDVVTGIIYSEDREQKYDFSIPIHTTYYSIFARKDLKIKDTSDLKGKKIVLLPGDVSINAYIKPMGLFENYTYVKSMPDAIMRIESGLYDYIIAPYSLGMEIINANDCKNVEVKGPVIMPSIYCLAVKKGNLKLLSMLNSGLEELRANGKLSEIQEKWIAFPYNGQKYQHWIKYTLFIIAGLVILFLFLLAWWFSLKKEVVKATNKIRETEEQYKNVFSSVRDALLVISPEGEIEDINPEALNLFGYTRDEIGRITAEGILSPGFIKKFNAFTSSSGDEDIPFTESLVIHNNSGPVYVKLKATPFKDKDQQYILVILHDVTDTKKYEDELVEAKKEAERANAIKSEFISHISHELRTPLNSISGFASLLSLSEKLDPKQQKFVDIIDNSANLLMEIINEILDNSKIEYGNIELEQHPVEINEIFDQVSKMLSYQSDKKGLTLRFINETDPVPVLIGDPLRLKQVITNLCNNAIKFTDEGEVIVRAYLKEDSILLSKVRIHFSVKDNGIGLKADEADKIFQPFNQANASVTRKYGGSGLGLSICKQLIELMGGTISVESDYGKGATFYFTVLFDRPE